MPISDKQLAANRANAKKSTGPKSAFGKAVCAMNGFAHGFTGLATVMTEEDRAAQTAFVKPYVQDLNPVGPVEIQLAQTLALDNFRVNRIKTVEENMFAYGEVGPLRDEIDTEHARVHHAIVQARVFTLNDKAFNNLSLYEQRITRNIHKNMKLLFELQARRKSEEEDKARLNAKTQPLTRTASSGSDQNGSGFANWSGLIRAEAEAEPPSTGRGSGFANRSGLRSGSLIPKESEAEPPSTGQGSGFALTFSEAENPAPTPAETPQSPITPPIKDADSLPHAPRQAA
jgi:hypothetical protein